MQGKYLIEAGCTVVDTPKIAEDLDALMSIRHPTPSSPALPVWLAWLTYPKLPRTSTYSASPDRFPFGMLCCPLMFGPNITGSASFHAMSDNSVRERATFLGALYQGEKGSYSAGASYDQSNFVIGFDASKSSAIFGRSSTVQPPSISLLPCIKF